MRGLARAASCGRKISCALDRKPRKLFFLPSHQDHDPSLGISKHAPHPSARPESWKAIGILECLLFSWHSSIMPFSRASIAVGPSAGAVGRAQNPHFSPTRFHEDPEIVRRVLSVARPDRIILFGHRRGRPTYRRAAPRASIRLWPCARTERQGRGHRAARPDLGFPRMRRRACGGLCRTSLRPREQRKRIAQGNACSHGAATTSRVPPGASPGNGNDPECFPSSCNGGRARWAGGRGCWG